MSAYVLVAAIAAVVVAVDAIRKYRAHRLYLALVAESCGLKVGRWESARSIRRRLHEWCSEPPAGDDP